MVKIIYGLILGIFYLGIRIASIFNKKARVWVCGRKGIWQKIYNEAGAKEHIIWFHCASLGEFEQGRPGIEEYRKKDPHAYILLTFFSPSGFEVQKNYKEADSVFYLPLDFRKNAKRFLDLIRPEIVVFIKYEFWYHYLHELWLRGIPTFLISANFRNNQWFFKWYGKPFRKILGFFEHMFVQNEKSVEILASHGLHKVTVAGDTRFDRVFHIAQHREKIPLAEAFKQQKTVVIAGSTWKEDEELLIRYINETERDIKWIIAPHEVHARHIGQIEASLRKTYIKYSVADINSVVDPRVLIIDNIGLLSSLYAYAEIAYVGGGFGTGIHNILEPAAFCIPVVFGPCFKKFQEAIDLIQLGGGVSIRSYEELINIFNTYLNTSEHLKKSGKIACEYVRNKLGATKMIVDNLLNV